MPAVNRCLQRVVRLALVSTVLGGIVAVVQIAPVASASVLPVAVTISSPSSAATLSQVALVAGTAAANSGIRKVEVKVDNGALHPATGTTSWSYGLDTTALSNGTHSVTARATDLTNHVTAKTISVNVVNVKTSGTTLLSSGSFGPNGLVTNEYAYWNPTAPQSIISPTWETTSGSLFSQGQQGWTGVPDDVNPNQNSSAGNDSAIFRLTTRESDFGDVNVSFSLLNNRLTSTPSTPVVDWDGIHLFLRYQSQYNLYYASVNRRDGNVVIKKKCAGGTSNGGTYYDLGNYLPGHAIPFGVQQTVSASVKNNPDGTVTLKLFREGQLLDSAIDTGVGCAPITAAGKVGIRGDNDDFLFRGFTVSAI